MNMKNIVIVSVLLIAIGIFMFYPFSEQKEPEYVDIETTLDLYSKALDHYKEGDNQKTVEYAGRIIELSEGKTLGFADVYVLSDSHTIRAAAYADMGDYDKAIADYTRVIEINPNNPRVLGAHIDRAFVRLETGDINGAIEDFDKAIDLDPEYILPYYYRGLIKVELGDREGGCSDLAVAAREEAQVYQDTYEEYCSDLYDENQQ